MAEIGETPHTQLDTQKIKYFSIWPLTQRIRDAVVQRLIEAHSSPSIFSKHYGTLTKEEASDIARRVEEEAFTFAGSSASSDDDEIEIVRVQLNSLLSTWIIVHICKKTLCSNYVIPFTS